MNLMNRVVLAEKMRAVKNAIAEVITDQFLIRHPDWGERNGERGRQRGIEDVCDHLDFLAGSVETGTVAPFQDYMHWTVNVLKSRGIDPVFAFETIRQIETHLAGHLSPVEQDLIRNFVQAGCDVASRGSQRANATVGERLALTRRLFMQALMQGSRKPALKVILDAFAEGSLVLDLYVDVIQESLYHVGQMWEKNQITVAEEHTATAIAQYVLAHLYERLSPPVERRGKAVITGIEGELHQVGANMIADGMEADGWDVRFLGTNLPHAGILKVVDEHQADVVGISVTMLSNMPKVRQLVTGMREKYSNRIRIIVGGGAFRSVPNFYSEIGADGFAHELRSAVELLRQPWNHALKA